MLLIEGRDRGGLEGELAVEHRGLCAGYVVFVGEYIVIISVHLSYSMGASHICISGINDTSKFE